MPLEDSADGKVKNPFAHLRNGGQAWMQHDGISDKKVVSYTSAKSLEGDR